MASCCFRTSIARASDSRRASIFITSSSSAQALARVLLAPARQAFLRRPAICDSRLFHSAARSPTELDAIVNMRLARGDALRLRDAHLARPCRSGTPAPGRRPAAARARRAPRPSRARETRPPPRRATRRARAAGRGQAARRPGGRRRLQERRGSRRDPARPRLMRPPHHELLAGEVVVEALALHQLVVRAVLDEPALLEHQDQVGVADRAQAVRDDEGRAPFEQRVHVLLHDALRLGVERARGLVEDQDRRASIERARDRDALALAAGERDARLADLGLVAERQPLDELVRVGDPRRPHAPAPCPAPPRRRRCCARSCRRTGGSPGARSRSAGAGRGS